TLQDLVPSRGPVDVEGEPSGPRTAEVQCGVVAATQARSTHDPSRLGDASGVGQDDAGPARVAHARGPHELDLKPVAGGGGDVPIHDGVARAVDRAVHVHYVHVHQTVPIEVGESD